MVMSHPAKYNHPPFYSGIEAAFNLRFDGTSRRLNHRTATCRFVRVAALDLEMADQCDLSHRRIVLKA
jgi:hypothetical protein